MLVVTYSSEHNHPWPVSRNHHSRPTITTKKPEPEPEPEPVEPEEEEEEEKFGDQLGGGGDELLGWLGEMETTSSAVLESPIMAGYDADVASMFMPMREEDESLFADLGELPECSTVFRQGMLDDRRRFTAPWCGTTS